jgi:hypothetical protein
MGIDLTEADLAAARGSQRRAEGYGDGGRHEGFGDRGMPQHSYNVSKARPLSDSPAVEAGGATATTAGGGGGDVPVVVVALRHELSSLGQLSAICSHADFLLLEASLFCAFGAGLFAINNVSTFVASAGGTGRQAAMATSAFPIGNALGRASFGLVSTARSGPLARVRRGLWLAIALGLMGCAYAGAAATYSTTTTTTTTSSSSSSSSSSAASASAAASPSLLPVYALVGVISPSYGLTWVSAQSILAESYPLEAFGTMLGLISLTAGAAGFCFNEVGAALYEAASAAAMAEAGDAGAGGHHAEAECMGSACFRSAFWLVSGCSAVGLVTALLFAPYTQRPDELVREEEEDAATVRRAAAMVGGETEL